MLRCSVCNHKVDIDEILKCSRCGKDICINCYEDATFFITPDDYVDDVYMPSDERIESIVQGMGLKEGDVVCTTCIEGYEVQSIDKYKDEDLPLLVGVSFYTDKACNRYKERLGWK